MGIYDKKSSVNPQDLLQNAKWPLVVIAAIALLFALVLILPTILSSDPISFSLSKNPFSGKEQSVLLVFVSNPSKETAKNVVVEVIAQDKASISVAPPVKTIPVLDQKRQVVFVINPVNALPGNYDLAIRAVINGKEFEKKLTVSINGTTQ